MGGFLDDPTGNTRFMVVKLNRINREYSKNVDVNQVWAQAVALYKSGRHIEPTENEIALLDSVNKNYEIEEPLTEMIQKHFDITESLEDFTSSLEILAALHDDGWKASNTKSEYMQIASALKQFNLQRSNKKPRGFFGIKKI